MIHPTAMTFFVAHLVCISTYGCSGSTSVERGTPEIRMQIEAYLESCSTGCPVSDIEGHLNLPRPAETESPASGWPHWKLKYFVNDLVVAFLADKVATGQQGFTYVGEPNVWLASDYWCEVSHKVPAH